MAKVRIYPHSATDCITEYDFYPRYMDFSKTVKSVTFGLKLADILNQTNNLNRIVSAEYVENRYSNVLGRMLLFSLSFNFGKINQDKTAAVSKGMRQFGY